MPWSIFKNLFSSSKPKMIKIVQKENEGILEAASRVARKELSWITGVGVDSARDIGKRKYDICIKCGTLHQNSASQHDIAVLALPVKDRLGSCQHDKIYCLPHVWQAEKSGQYFVVTFEKCNSCNKLIAKRPSLDPCPACNKLIKSQPSSSHINYSIGDNVYYLLHIQQ